MPKKGEMTSKLVGKRYQVSEKSAGRVNCPIFNKKIEKMRIFSRKIEFLTIKIEETVNFQVKKLIFSEKLIKNS